MQLLTNNNYSIQYQCYSTTEETSWSGTIDFSPDRDYKDLMSWFKAEKPDLVKHLCEFPVSEGREPKLEQFWLFIAKEGDMEEACEKLTEEDVSEILQGVESEQEAKDRIKNYIVSMCASGFVQWHKHPKRMSQYGKDTLIRLTSDNGIYKLLGVAEQVHTDQADYNTWGLRLNKKTA